MSKTPKSPKSEASIVEPLTQHTDDAKHLAAMQHLREECMEVEYSISWLPTTRVVSAANKQRMLDVVNGRKRGLSVSKRLFCSSHPLLSELNDARTRLSKWRDGFVIVKGAEATQDETNETKIVGGVRLIATADIEQFEAGFKVRVDELYAVAAKVQEYMHKPYFDGKKTWPSILDADRQEVGNDFNIADYPDNVATCIQVIMPTYTPYAVSLKLPAAVRARQEQRLAEALNSTLETATAYISNTLTDVFTQFANSLTNRTRVFPNDAKFAKYHGAEVVTYVETAGMASVVLRYKRPDASQPGKEQTITETLDTMPIAEYNTQLRPQTTDERKKLSTSVLENIYTQFDTLSKVKGMLGPYGESLENTISKIRDVLTAGGTTNAEVLNEAKNSQYFRGKLVAALHGAVEELEATTQDVKKVRRKISSKLLGQV